MYSVVLLMAITAGGESADGCRGCRGCGCYSGGCRGCRSYCGCGCYGCYGCASYGCYSCGCYSACSCYRPVVSYGCSTGCTVYHGCAVTYSAPVYHGCAVVHHGCAMVHHGCTVVHHGCTVPSCVGGHLIKSVPIDGAKKGAETPAGKEEVKANSTTATIVVALPADAKVTIDGQKTAASAASVRYFESPSLADGKTYAYTFVAEYNVDGQSMKVSKEVRFQAGKVVNLDLTTGGTAVARK